MNVWLMCDDHKSSWAIVAKDILYLLIIGGNESNQSSKEHAQSRTNIFFLFEYLQSLQNSELTESYENGATSLFEQDLVDCFLCSQKIAF